VTPRPSVRVLAIFGIMDRGGAELRVIDLLRNLGPGYTLHVCSLSGREGTLDDEIRRLGGEVHYCRLGWGFGRRFRALLRRERFTTVHSNVFLFSGYILRLAAAEGVPVRVAQFHSSGSREDARSLRRRLQYAVTRRWLSRYATRIVGVSESAINLAWTPEWRRDPRCEVVYNGVDAPDLGPGDALATRLALGVDPEAPMLVHVGRLNRVKNHAKLLAVFARFRERHPHARLVVVGGGLPAYLAELQALAERLGVAPAVLFTGERTDVPQLLNAADILVFPSFHEGLPGAVMEACSLGLPVLASDLPVIGESGSRVDGVEGLSLQVADDEWARRADVLRTRPDSPARRQLRDAFARSNLGMRQFVEAHERIWAGG
jgi:glycosyltransferase involved in cell wall biosynthesis